MNKFKIIFASVLATAMLVGASACSSSSSGESTADDSSATANASSAESTSSTDWPSETITIVVPYSAGGGTDLGARYLATALQKELDATVVVENVPGSGGWIGWNQVMKNSDTNGYTLGAINHNFVMGAYDDVNPREETLEDVQLLANQVIDYNVLAIRPDETRFTDLESFVEYAKENPILISAQSTGITDGDATTAEWFKKNLGCQIDVVPVDGASDGMSMFLAGDTDIYFGSVSDVYNKNNSGELKTICVFAPERSEYLPDVATLTESGLGDFSGYALRGYFYPQGVPQEVVTAMTDAMMKAMEDPEYLENMNNLGVQLHPTTGDEFAQLLNAQLDIRKVIWDVQ